LKIEDGRLWVSSPFAAGDKEWVDTGDLVQRHGERIFITGRAERGFINVGGTKVDAGDVESVLAAHPAVLWCRVRGVKSATTGQLVVATVLADPRADVTEPQLRRFAAARLPEAAQPRVIDFVSEIPTTEVGKSAV